MSLDVESVEEDSRFPIGGRLQFEAPASSPVSIQIRARRGVGIDCRRPSRHLVGQRAAKRTCQNLPGPRKRDDPQETCGKKDRPLQDRRDGRGWDRTSDPSRVKAYVRVIRGQASA
jgi:hypothetical protein